MKLIPKRKVVDREGFSSTMMELRQNFSDNIENITNEVAGDIGIIATIYGGGSAITTGVKGFIHIPCNCELTGGSLLADQTGSIKVDIWKDLYANHAPTDADSICSSNELQISAGIKDEDFDLTGWTKDFTKREVLAVNVDSCTTVEVCTLTLFARRT